MVAIYHHITKTLIIPEDASVFMCVVMNRWRAHVDNVTCLTLVEEQKILITSSLDCTVRVWTFDGDYVG